jgi:hypothetical protein
MRWTDVREATFGEWLAEGGLPGNVGRIDPGHLACFLAAAEAECQLDGRPDNQAC